MPRLFVALPLPDPLRDALAAHQRGPDVTWAARDTLHITVKFLGDVDEAHVPALTDALAPVAAETPPLSLLLTGFGTFPKRPPAKTLWVGVRGDLANLYALSAAVDLAAADFDVPRDRGSYLPHVTLGRSKQGAPDKVVARLATLRAVGAFTARHLVLYRSVTHSEGVEHSPLATVPLGAEIEPRTQT